MRPRRRRSGRAAAGSSGAIGTRWSCGTSSPKLRPPGSTRSCGASDEQERVHAVAGDLAAATLDALGELRLDPLPLGGERLLPVRLEQRQRSARRSGPGRRTAAPRRGGTAGRAVPARFSATARTFGRREDAAPGGTQRRRRGRRSGAAGRRRRRPCAGGERGASSDLEVVVARGGGREQDAVGQRPAVEERERRDLAPQRRRQRPHRADPAVLERVVLRLREDVQAEDALEERRVAEGDAAVRALSEARSESRSINLRAPPGAASSSGASIFSSANQLTGRARDADPGGVRRILLLCLLPLALGASPGRERRDATLLVGTVGPGFTIDLADANGKHVDMLTRGPLPAARPRPLRHPQLRARQQDDRASASRRRRSRSSETRRSTSAWRPASTCTRARRTSRRCSAASQVVSAPTATPPTGKLSAKVTPTAVSVSAKSVEGGRLQADRRRPLAHAELPPRRLRREPQDEQEVHGQRDLAARSRGGTYRFGSDPRLTGRLVVRSG